MHEGHVKLYRKLRHSPYYQDSQYIHIWVHLLMSVNWKKKRVKLKNSDQFIDVLPGQILTSRDAISKETGINASKVERILSALKSEQQIEQQTFSKYRVISITNWHVYQLSEQQIEQQMNSRRTADEHKEEGKEVKEENLLPTCKAWKDYLLMRVKIKKPMTPKAMELAGEKLAKLAESGHDPIAVLNQSTFNSWQGLFGVKKDKQQRGFSDDWKKSFLGDS